MFCSFYQCFSSFVLTNIWVWGLIRENKVQFLITWVLTTHLSFCLVTVHKKYYKVLQKERNVTEGEWERLRIHIINFYYLIFTPPYKYSVIFRHYNLTSGYSIIKLRMMEIPLWEKGTLAPLKGLKKYQSLFYVTASYLYISDYCCLFPDPGLFCHQK